MTKEERRKMRKILDEELTFGFKKNEWFMSWALIWFALRVEVISEEEYKWLDAAAECLGMGE